MASYIELRKCRLLIQVLTPNNRIINLDNAVGLTLENTGSTDMAVSYEGEGSEINIAAGDTVKIEVPALFCLAGTMEAKGNGTLKAYIYKPV